MGVRITNNLMAFITKNTEVLDLAFARGSKDIIQIAKIKVPLKEGDLMESGESIRIGPTHYKAVFDTEYAGFQEAGQRKDGSHIVKNYTTSGTGKDFLKEAGEKVANGFLNYIKQAAQSIRL